MKSKQIVVIVAVVAVIGYLYSLPPVKGNTEASVKKGTGSVAAANKPSTDVTVQTVSASAKKFIGDSLSTKISGLEDQLRNATSDADKLALDKKLAQQWSLINQPGPAAFYYQAIARSENTAESWIVAGNHFNDAYKQAQDTTAQPVFDADAVEAFQVATKLKPESLDAKTGLGIAYVNGGGPPMQGIGLLLDVVKQDPTNYNAELNLGMFAMKSGQFEKAVDRFKTIISQKPGVEPYFYLAESYKQLGMKTEAIAAYEECKKMMPDPTFGQKIDEYIKELKN
ncbi:tetratricopeptide repeat protein [Mucilaginibacter sp.]